MTDEQPLIRRLGQLIETIHAVVYFAPEPLAAYEDLGLRGYWRGYFAGRTAAVGRVGAPLAVALLGGFAPPMVARALPQVWETVTPAQVLEARSSGATAALRRLIGDAGATPDLAGATALTELCCVALPLAGRPMAAAHVGLPRPADPLAALWADCTVLREYRGDAHLAALAAHGLQWPLPHLLQGANVDPRQQQYRGWDDESWEHARAASRTGANLVDVETLTDAMTEPAFAPLDDAARHRLVALLEPVAAAAARQLPYPNAMGLPQVTPRR